MLILNGKWRGQPETTSVVLPDYTLSREEIRLFQNELNVMAETVQPYRTAPEEVRARWAFDCLLDNITYDLAARHSQDAFGALIEGARSLPRNRQGDATYAARLWPADDYTGGTA